MTASASQVERHARPSFAVLRGEAGFVSGGVGALLRLEGLAAFAAALAFYAHGGFSWTVFAILFLAPDLSMVAYLVGPRAGAFGYNLMHTYSLALGLALAGFFGGAPMATALGLIWIAHIGFDRALGYGLKYGPDSATRISAAPANTDRTFTSTPARKGAAMRIHAIETGRVRIKQAQIEGRGHGLWRRLQPIVSQEWSQWSPIYAWAIEHPEGVIIVDTGANVGLKSLPLWHPYFQFAVRFDIEPEQEIGPQLRQRGIGARDVRTVVLTHMHIDHDGGLAHFPNSRVLVNRDEIARTSGANGAINGYLPKRWPKWFAPEAITWQPSAYGPFQRSAPITKAGDIVAVPTPGHTPGHISVIVRDAEQQIVVAGDASYLESTMLRGVVDGVSDNEAAATNTLADIRALCASRPTVYVTAHDPESAERLQQRRATRPSAFQHLADAGDREQEPRGDEDRAAGWRGHKKQAMAGERA